jgi:hypothetical protein
MYNIDIHDIYKYISSITPASSREYNIIDCDHDIQISVLRIRLLFCFLYSKSERDDCISYVCAYTNSTSKVAKCIKIERSK